MSLKDNACRKFQANIFNKSKCQNCFKPRESHLLNDEDLNQVKINFCTLNSASIVCYMWGIITYISGSLLSSFSLMYTFQTTSNKVQRLG